MQLILANSSNIEELIHIANEARKTIYKKEIEPLFYAYMRKLFYIDKILEKRISLIAIDNNKPIGYILFSIRFENENKYCEIDQLFIMPNSQKKGIGTYLIKNCQDIIKNFDIKRIVVAAEHTAIKFYQKQNFILTDKTFPSVLIKDLKFPYLEKNI